MPLRIAEQIRAIAVQCAQISRECPDKKTADAIEAVSIDLAQRARALEHLYNELVEAS
jgi:hypothetical protein